MKIFKQSNIFVLVHFFCWLILGLVVFYNHPADWEDNVPPEFWIRQTLLLILLMFVFYVNYQLLIPSLLIQKSIYIYVVVVIGLVTGLTYLIQEIVLMFNLNDLHFPRPHSHPKFLENHGHWDTFVPGMILLMIGLGITVSFIQKWQQEVSLRQQLEQEKVTTELMLLKAQINPHFFFNTLNTIYSYTLSDGDVARTAIMNLSKMMRYVLYDAAGRQTPLRKEIAFIKEYVELMKLRITTKTTVSLQVIEQPAEVMIAPMLFLPFVENAFKHGVSGIEEGHIAVSIEQDENYIKMIVTNTVYDSKRTREESGNGIGIINTKRRLDLLYPQKYTLDTGMVNLSKYEIKLSLLL